MLHAQVDRLCHPCPLDSHGAMGRRYRAYAYILWIINGDKRSHLDCLRRLSDKMAARGSRREDGGGAGRGIGNGVKVAGGAEGGEESGMTAGEIMKLLAAIDCNSIAYDAQRCAVFARGSKVSFYGVGISRAAYFSSSSA